MRSPAIPTFVRTSTNNTKHNAVSASALRQQNKNQTMKSKMKTNTTVRLTKWLASLTALAALAGSNTLQAQTWQTVLNYQLAAGKTADGDGIVADASGNVFSGGNGNDASGTNHGIVLKTDTTQANWYFGDDTNPSATQYQSYLWNLGLDASGSLYSIGQLTPDSTGIPYWYVRKSFDSGVHWSTVDLYQYATGQWGDATGFAADNSGNIYVVGGARDAGTKRNPMGNLHWLVRRSTDGGQTWALVDDVIGESAYHAGFVPGAGLFVVGHPYGSSWLVRRSLTGALGTWSTVDNPFAGGACSVCSDNGGNIYVAGTALISTQTKGSVTSYYVWITRKSTDGGNTWATVDTFAYTQNQTAKALGMARNSAGNVVVAGYAYDAQGKRHWIVRTPDSSGAWYTMDDFQPGNGASALGVVTDAAGNLLVTGTALNVTGPGDSHWIVRRLAP
jgi:hypothetical protein